MRDAALTVDEQVLGEARVLAPSGEIDHATTPVLANALRRATLEDHGPVVVDLCEVTFIDSAGISTLLNALRRLTRRRRRMLVVCPPGRLRRIFELVGLVGTFELFESRAEALAGI